VASRSGSGSLRVSNAGLGAIERADRAPCRGGGAGRGRTEACIVWAHAEEEVGWDLRAAGVGQRLRPLEDAAPPGARARETLRELRE
jgi:hypothetical protein